MKKSSKIVLSFLMAATVIFGFTGCGEKKVTFTNKTVNGISLDVPDDFKAFEEKNGTLVASNEDSTASIGISKATEAEGLTVEDWTEDSYKETILTNYEDVKLVEFKNDVKISGKAVVYAYYTAKNDNGVDVEVYNYLIFSKGQDDSQTFQVITLAYNKDAKTSLQNNIDNVKNSIIIK